MSDTIPIWFQKEGRLFVQVGQFEAFELQPIYGQAPDMWNWHALPWDYFSALGVTKLAAHNPLILNAVRLAYYTGDFKGAIDVIAEAVGEHPLAASENLLASDGKAANLAAEGET